MLNLGAHLFASRSPLRPFNVYAKMASASPVAVQVEYELMNITYCTYIHIHITTLDYDLLICERCVLVHLTQVGIHTGLPTSLVFVALLTNKSVHIYTGSMVCGGRRIYFVALLVHSTLSCRIRLRYTYHSTDCLACLVLLSPLAPVEAAGA